MTCLISGGQSVYGCPLLKLMVSMVTEALTFNNRRKRRFERQWDRNGFCGQWLLK